MRLTPLGWRCRVTIKGTTWHLAMSDGDSACGRYRDLDVTVTLRMFQVSGTVCKSCARILNGPD